MSLLRSTAVMTAGTAVSRALGFARAAVLATALGATFAAGNSFDIANKIPNNLYMLVAGGMLNAVLVPQLVRASKREDGGRDFSDRLLTVAGAFLLGITVVLTLLAGLLVRLYSQGWAPDQLALATAFALWCVPQVFFYGLYTLLGQVLNARGSFGPYMWAPVVNNVVAIAGLALFIAVYGVGAEGQHPVREWDAAMIALVGGTATLGVVAQALVLVLPLRRAGFRWRPRFGVRGVGMRAASRVAGWTLASVTTAQLAFVVTSRVAAAAGEANRGTPLEAVTPGNFAYTLAFLLYMLPHSLVAVSLVTALFTQMSAAAASGDHAAVRSDVAAGIRSLAVFSVLASTALVVLGGPASFVVAGGTPEIGQAVGLVTSAMALGLVGFSTNYLVVRAFYAYEDARTPFLAQLTNIAVLLLGNVASALLLPARYVVVGVGLSVAAGHLTGAVASATLLRRRLGHLEGRRTLRHLVRLGVAAVVTGAAGAGVAQLMDGVTWTGRLGALTTCLVAGAAMTAVYAGALRVMRVRELDQLATAVLGRLRRG